MTTLTNQEIFDQAREYLLGLPRVTKEILDRQIAFPEQNRPRTKSALFQKMIDCAKNRQGMPNAIGDIAKLTSCLHNFDADAVLQKYRSWEGLFDTIKQAHKPPGRMEPSNAHSYWVVFCKTILSVAKFVNRFSTIEDFDKYVAQFITDTPDTRLALPLILKEEIFGYQFALACDFIKENVSPLFVKPDVHIRAIFTGIGKSEQSASDFQIFRDVIAFSQSINQVPYTVDKLFWLIGSGKFYSSGIKTRPDRQAFIDQVNAAAHRRFGDIILGSVASVLARR